MKQMTLGLSMLFALCSYSSAGLAGPLLEKSLIPPIELAQFEADDAYDPFADYSEFEASTEEEADIHFFRNGRFFTLGIIGGYRWFTDTLGSMYEPALPSYGVFLSYFFDMRFALQISYLIGNHAINFKTQSGTPVRGDASIHSLGLSLKYFMNIQNVSKGLGNFNPYVILGFSSVSRTTTLQGNAQFVKDNGTGFDIGAGIEFPIQRNQQYIGAQVSYQLVTFKNENSELPIGDESNSGVFPSGDIANFLLIYGFNF